MSDCKNKEIILASASPRRREILENLNIKLCVSGLDEELRSLSKSMNQDDHFAEKTTIVENEKWIDKLVLGKVSMNELTDCLFHKLFWNISDKTRCQFGRFLYRVLRFSEQYGKVKGSGWFELDAVLECLCKCFDRYLKNNNNIVTFGLGYKETNIEENIFDELDISLQKIIFK